jgi:putative flippase GtrA
LLNKGTREVVSWTFEPDGRPHQKVLVDPVVQSTNSGWARRTFDRLWPLRWRFLAYVVVGASGVLVNLLAFNTAERHFGTSHSLVLVASSFAFAVALLWNFAWNYLWTFRDRRDRPIYYHFGMYAVIQIGALLLNLGTLYVWTSRFGVGSAIWGQLLGVLVGSAWGFGANLRWNFRVVAPAIQS